MKKLLIPLISVILNACYVLGWVYVYNTFETHHERVNAFLRYIPKGLSNGFWSTFLIFLSIISVFILAKSELKSWIKMLLLWVQGGFTCLLVWQWM